MNDIDPTTKMNRRRLVYLNQRIAEVKQELDALKQEREGIKATLQIKTTAQ